MRNTWKKSIAWLLCLVMLLALVPSLASADDTENDEQTIELSESETTEPEETLLSNELSPCNDTETPELPADEPSGDDTETPELPVDTEHIVLEDALIIGSNKAWIYEAGKMVYWRILPTEDVIYEFNVRDKGVICVFTDDEFDVIDRIVIPDNELKNNIMPGVLHAGETYYLGVQHSNLSKTGSILVCVESCPVNACGNNITWKFFPGDGVLSIGSYGKMWDYKPNTVPWMKYRDQIKTLRLFNSGGSSWKSIGSYAFYGCSNLASIENMSLMRDIGSYAFYGTAIDAVACRGAVGSYAFANCKNLTKAFLKEQVTSVGQYAFAGCENLVKLTMEDRIKWIGAHAFEDTGLKTVALPDQILAIPANLFANCKDLTTVTLPQNLEKIRENAFLNCGITALQLPEKVNEIHFSAFKGCKNLAPSAFKVDAANETFSAKNGTLLSRDGSTLLIALYRAATGAYTTPVGVQTVAENSFTGCTALTELTLTPGVAMVEKDALKGCTALNKVMVPLTLKTIQSGAFADCDVKDVYYAGTEAERNHNLSVDPEGNDAFLNAEWHYTEPTSFDGTAVWNEEDVQIKNGTPYVVYSGSAFTPRFTLLSAEGETVNPATYTVEYRENVEAGTGYAFVTFTEGYTGTLRLYFKIYLPATEKTYVENVENGIRISWEPVEGAAGYVIYRRAWNLVDAGWTTFERWNNTPNLVWTDTAVYAGTRYQYGVKAYFDRRMDAVTGVLIGGNVGDNFNLGVVGPLKTTVRITTRHLNSLKPGDGAITANWDASKVFTGYQLKYATDEAFTKNLASVKVSNAKTQSTVLKSLTNGTAYYVRVRSYHEFAGMTYFGQWSNMIRVKPGSGQTMYDVMYRALLIGENNYSGDLALKGPINDMNAMAGMLKGLKRPFQVKTLPNSNKTAILNAIKSTYADAMDSDISLFYYSGHGTDARGDQTYQGALVPIDENLITMKELAEMLSKVRGRVIVILDSCQSGAAIARSGEDAAEAFNRSAIEAFSGYWLEPEDGIDGQTAKMGEFRKSKFIVLTASTERYPSYEGKFDGSGYYQGAFTAALIRGMGCKYPNGSYSGPMPADVDKNQEVTLHELYTYAYNRAYNWTYQYAQYYGPDSEVLFRR